jgi:hypothetical protein
LEEVEVAADDAHVYQASAESVEEIVTGSEAGANRAWQVGCVVGEELGRPTEVRSVACHTVLDMAVTTQ